MDQQKFGSFVASIRKEQGMTQTELAQKLHVTDKAVSRWERGLGFPDIHTFEPLAEALQISVLELMKSERNAQSLVTKDEAVQAVTNTLQVAHLQWKQAVKRVTKRLLVAAAALLVLVGVWLLLTGSARRTDVYLGEYAALPSGDVLTIHVGVAGSMGYIRSCSDVSKETDEVILRFYSAFGGLNSALGAQDVFLVSVKDADAVYFDSTAGPRLVLQRNDATGAWERVP